jgi:hypothetical protein
MTCEIRNSPLLDNGSLITYPRQRTGLWESQSVGMKLTHVFGATDKHRMTDGLYEMVIFIRFAPKL